MNYDEFQELVIRYFRGQLSDNEYDIMLKNLQDEKCREIFDQEKLLWEDNPQLDNLGAKNLTRLLFKIDQQEEGHQTEKLRRKIWLRIASVAAILAVGLLIGGMLTYYLSNADQKTERLVFETPRGMKSIVKLPDGSEVWLNANSCLVYNSFSSNSRNVELKGEAFFKVAHNEAVPFIVHTNKCNVRVLGTIFNVMAYEDFGRTEVALLSGKVDVEASGKEKVLIPGQTLILRETDMQIAEANSERASDWVNNKFNFKDIPLSELIKRLENWYDVDITLENPTNREVNYSGTFKNEETIWQVLDAIKMYMFIEYEKVDTRKIKIVVK
jgi:Fe2+-dicitrate sensor, membrane component